MSDSQVSAIDKEQARENLKRLIQRYQTSKEHLTNEEQTCQSLILPLFRDVLGWDTEDPAEFKAQESQKTGKRSDYVTSINGISQFVIEVKSAQEEIKQDYGYYEQAINYAKYKEKVFAILTNFRSLIILRADTEEQPLQCEVRNINVEKILDNDTDFDVLWNFNKNLWTAEKGEGLYRLLRPGKKAIPVSKNLVVEMSRWRLALLNSISRNRALNSFVDFSKERTYIKQELQRLIERLIFICYCEDKELRDRELRNLLEIKEAKHSGNDHWLGAQIKDLYSDYRRQYDSDLFFEGDCDKFVFQDAVLTEIVRDLRKPNRKLPYNFAEIDADVLGKAYENFIGHVITGEKRLSEKESISKRKEEGAYYTPQYIVNYIVDNTLREHIKQNKIISFAELLKVKVLDPACGSGTFLIRALDVLEEEARKILGRAINEDEKVQLATSCIFGVDLDERAVDMAKLRLSLALAAKHKLPQLGKNIQCGNSLIDDYTIAHEKAFKWEERFKDIMQNGGFDVVVGNPPYGAELEQFKSFILKKYSTNLGKLNSYRLFIERALRLISDSGFLGFIIPNTWLSDNDSGLLRKLILTETKLKKVLVLPEALKVFENVTQATTILVLEKEDDKSKIENNIVTFFDDITRADNFEHLFSGKIKQAIFQEFEGNKILTKEPVLGTINKISKAGKLRLNEFFVINQGEVNLTVYKKSLRMEKKSNSRKLIRGNSIERYSINLSKNEKESYVIFPNLRRDDSSKIRIVLQEVSNMSQKRRLKATLLDFQANLAHTCNYLYFKKDTKNDNILYFIGLLNSKVLDFYFKTFSNTNHISGLELRQIPILLGTKKEQEKISGPVDKMLSLHKHLNEMGDKHTVERERIEEEIRKTDAEIDELVYQLYGITDEEKKIIEDSLR